MIFRNLFYSTHFLRSGRPHHSYSTSSPLPPTASGSLSSAECARHLCEVRKTGIFSSVINAGDIGGQPLFASRVSYVPRPGHQDILVGLPESSPHLANLLEYALGSLLLFPLVPQEHNPAEFPILPKLNVGGRAARVEEGAARAEALAALKSRHRISDKIVAGIAVVRLELDSVSYSDGGRQAVQLEPAAFWQAQVDPLAVAAAHIVEEINLPKHERRLKQAVKFYSEQREAPRSAFVFGLDRHGFDVLVEDREEKWDRMRMPFPMPMADPELALKAVLEGLEEAINQLGEKEEEED